MVPQRTFQFKKTGLLRNLRVLPLTNGMRLWGALDGGEHILHVREKGNTGGQEVRPWLASLQDELPIILVSLYSSLCVVPSYSISGLVYTPNTIWQK